MEKVLGIGGFFFRAENPEALGEWYQTNLGIDLPPMSYDATPWQQQAGITIFAPFPKATDDSGKPEKQWTINFRVSNLDAMAEQLRKNGVEVTIDPEQYPNGRFASLSDPEGNPIQLWEEATPGAG
jgi:predicted enzyme related to lactoylglutathione lyase